MYDENLFGILMKFLFLFIIYRGFSLSVLILFVRGFLGFAKCKFDCLERLWVILYYLYLFIYY